MVQDTAIAFLESLWMNLEPERLRCVVCERKIEQTEVLCRTFSLREDSPNGTNLPSVAEAFDVPGLSEQILVRHRHLECLATSTTYIVVSHVWHPEVADLQYRRSTSATPTDDVARVVCEIPAKIYRGIRRNNAVEGHFEIWHDYISVPQWQPALKTRIIQSIPEIFKNAKMTIAHLADTDAETVRRMREGFSIEERVRGISGMCNAKLFSRVWTAMEFVQSRNLRAMLKDFTIVSDNGAHEHFLHEMHEAWKAEVRNLGDHLAIESMAHLGENLVPWQLGPLSIIRERNLAGYQVIFALGYELLARRCVTIPTDFFHAFLGVMKTGLTVAELDGDPERAMLQIARRRMEKSDDYSPIFMIPKPAQAPYDPQRNGYLDLGAFVLGHVINPPRFQIALDSGNPVVKAEKMGVVTYARRSMWLKNPMETFCFIVRQTLDFNGPDVEAFVTTVAVRFYGRERNAVFERLSRDRRGEDLQRLVTELYNFSSDDVGHLRNFTDRMADLLGLCDTDPSSPTSEVSPILFMMYHGHTIHLGPNAAMVGIKCPTCGGVFLLRVGLLRTPSEVLGSVAYRIPGLQYLFTHRGGVGLLLKNGRMVGRFVWGALTCSCPQIEEVKITLVDMPLPEPNKFQYGHHAW